MGVSGVSTIFDFNIRANTLLAFFDNDVWMMVLAVVCLYWIICITGHNINVMRLRFSKCSMVFWFSLSTTQCLVLNSIRTFCTLHKCSTVKQWTGCAGWTIYCISSPFRFAQCTMYTVFIYYRWMRADFFPPRAIHWWWQWLLLCIMIVWLFVHKMSVKWREWILDTVTIQDEKPCVRF